MVLVCLQFVFLPRMILVPPAVRMGSRRMLFPYDVERQLARLWISCRSRLQRQMGLGIRSFYCDFELQSGINCADHQSCEYS